jgi:histidine triad (HIT) family protein
MEDCIFCKIANKKLPAEFVFESENIVAFPDINPKAKVHILIVPKKHIESVKTLQEIDKNLIGEMFLAVQKIAKDQNLEGYKLIINVGKDGGQLVDHLHLHLVSPDVKCEHKI